MSFRGRLLASVTASALVASAWTMAPGAVASADQGRDQRAVQVKPHKPVRPSDITAVVPPRRQGSVRLMTRPQRRAGVRLVVTARLPRPLSVRGRHLHVARTSAGVRTATVRLVRRDGTLLDRVRVTVISSRSAAARGTVRVTTGYDGRPADAGARDVTVAGGGGFVVYDSAATNLVRLPPGATEDQRVYRWDAATGRTTLVSPASSARLTRNDALDVSADGRFVLYASVPVSADGGVVGPVDLWLWDATNAQRSLVSEGFRASPVARVSADGATVTYQGGALDYPQMPPEVRRWDRATGTATEVVTPLDPESTATPKPLGWTGIDSADGRWLLLRGETRSHLWDSSTGTITWSEWLGWDYVQTGTVSPDGRRMTISGYGPNRGAGAFGLPVGRVWTDLAGPGRDSRWGAAMSADGLWTAEGEPTSFTVGTGAGRRPALTGTPYFARGLTANERLPAEPSFSADGSAFGYAHTAENLVRGGSGGVQQVYFWRP